LNGSRQMHDARVITHITAAFFQNGSRLYDCRFSNEIHSAITKTGR